MMRLWHLFQRCRRFTSHALWVVPFSAIIIELIVYRLLHALDDMLGWQLQRFSAAGAQALLETIITMTLSFVVFTFGSLLVAIQVAGGQLTPRVIATTLLRDNVVRYTVGLFVFTRLCSATVAARQYSVPGRRRWPYRDRGCLSSTGTRSVAAAHQVSDYWDAFPDRSSCR